MSSIHQFQVKGILGDTIDFADFKGKKILLVNVASECGFTPQYQQLQELYEFYQDKLVVVACPCNDFGAQEPAAAEEIHAFCSRTYGVSFPISAKLNIKSEPIAPLYDYLMQQANEQGYEAYEVKWNFHKFLLDEQGQLLAAFPSSVSPIDEQITSIVSQ